MNPVLNQIGTVFIPISDIEKARDWYCRLLGVEADREVLFGHLYVLPMDGTGIVLDSKIYAGENTFKAPAFHFNTNDIQSAYEFVVSLNIEPATGIENGHWFNFKDPDGNMLMICKC